MCVFARKVQNIQLFEMLEFIFILYHPSWQQKNESSFCFICFVAFFTMGWIFNFFLSFTKIRARSRRQKYIYARNEIWFCLWCPLHFSSSFNIFFDSISISWFWLDLCGTIVWDWNTWWNHGWMTDVKGDSHGAKNLVLVDKFQVKF